MVGEHEDGAVRNEFHGQAKAVVQARDVHGDLVINISPEGTSAWQDDALRSLFRAQRQAAEVTPYRLLTKNVPPLSLIYVEQRAERSEEVAASHREMPLFNVLAAARHVLILGEPGGGKSTLAQHLIKRTAAWWLEPQGDPPFGRVIPLRLPAQMLAGTALAEAVIEACDAELGPHLDAPLPSGLLNHALTDADWLIVVDGLDEILDAERRERVVHALAARIADPDFPHRFLITSRLLPEGELDELRETGAAEFRLRLFTQSEITRFALRWFDARNKDDAVSAVSGYLRAVERSGLQDLVRVPLLASISAIIYEHDRRLPSSKAGLYSEFLRYLLHVRQRTLHAREELERQLAPYSSAGERIAGWIFDQREAILTELASTWIAVDETLSLEIALRWIEQECPFPVTGIPDLKSCVEGLLLSTGLIIHEAGAMSFLHQSFAEYLAASEIARRLDDIDTWVHMAFDPPRHNLAMFAVDAWAHRTTQQQVDTLIEYLLAGRAERPDGLPTLDDLFFEEAQILLAGEILADGLPCSTEAVEQVVERLLDLARDPAVTTASGALDILQRLPGNPQVGDGLTALADEEELETWVRREAARLHTLHSPNTPVRTEDPHFVENPAVGIGTALALAELNQPEDAVAILYAIAADRQTDRGWRSEAAAGIRDLGLRMGFYEQARQTLKALVESSPFPSSELIDWLAELGDKESAAAGWFKTVRWSRSLPHTLDAVIHGRVEMETHAFGVAVRWMPPTSDRRSFYDIPTWSLPQYAFEMALYLTQNEDPDDLNPSVEHGSALHSLRRWSEAVARIFDHLTKDEFYQPITDAAASVAVNLLLTVFEEIGAPVGVQQPELRRLEPAMSQLSELARRFPGSPAQAAALGTLAMLGETSHLITDAISISAEMPSASWIRSTIAYYS